jgi:lipopolysaccharide export system permease protein
VCRYFIGYFCGGLAGCAALLLLVECFDRIDTFVGRQVWWIDAGQYLALRLPWMVYQMVPAACLLASVLTFSTLNRHQETVAMRAHGISPLRLTCPLFILGGVVCGLLLLSQEYLLPYTNQGANLIWRTRIQRVKVDPRLGLFKKGQIWYRSPERMWSAQSSLPFEQRLLGVTIYALDAHGLIRERYDAAEARYDDRGWILSQGVYRRFTPQGLFAGPPERFEEMRTAFSEHIDTINTLPKELEELSLSETLASAHEAQSQRRPETRYLVEFHGKLAYAALCILMAGFGMPLVLHMNRNGGTTLALSLTLLCGFAYVILHNLILALGYNGRLPPAVAAWAANGLFGGGGAYLAARLR